MDPFNPQYVKLISTKDRNKLVKEMEQFINQSFIKDYQVHFSTTMVDKLYPGEAVYHVLLIYREKTSDDYYKEGVH